MAKHLFDRNGRRIGSILDDNELPEESGCFSNLLADILAIAALVVMIIFVTKCYL